MHNELRDARITQIASPGQPSCLVRSTCHENTYKRKGHSVTHEMFSLDVDRYRNLLVQSGINRRTAPGGHDTSSLVSQSHDGIGN
jgi:hypothetical protein